MGYFFLLLYLALNFLRPADLYPDLAVYRLSLVAGSLGLIASPYRCLRGKGPTFRAYQIPLMIGFMIWAVLTILFTTHYWPEMVHTVESLSPPAIVFFLILIHVTTFRRLAIVGGLLVVLISIVVCQGLMATFYGYNAELFVFKQHIELVNAQNEPLVPEDAAYDPNFIDAEGLPYVPRMRGAGVLNDPNDLAQAIVVILPFLWLAWRPRRHFRNFVFVLAPGAFLIFGMYWTHSRGGMISLLVLFMLVMMENMGRTKSIIVTGIAAAALLVLGFSGGRSMADESSQGRINFWSEGMHMLSQSPLWGVGYDAFRDYNPEHVQGMIQVAHNSFVHCFAELGLIGYFIWLSILLTTIVEVSSLRNLPVETKVDFELARWATLSRLSLLTFLAAAWFLSRTYSELLFMLLAISLAVVDLARKHGKPIAGFTLGGWAQRIAGFEFASIALVWVIVVSNHLLR